MQQKCFFAVHSAQPPNGRHCPTLDTTTNRCICVRGCARHLEVVHCAQQKSTFAACHTQPPKCCGHNLDHSDFLTNRSNSCPLGFKLRVEFGYAFGNEKHEHRFVRLNASKMNALIPQHAMSGTPPNQASMLYVIVATTTY